MVEIYSYSLSYIYSSSWILLYFVLLVINYIVYVYMFSVTSVMFAIYIIGLLYSVYNPIRILYDACISYI